MSIDRSVRTSLVSFSEWCVLIGLMDDNPAVPLPRGRGDEPNPRPAPDGVWHQLIEAAPPRERLMARLAGEAGMRRAEIARVRPRRPRPGSRRLVAHREGQGPQTAGGPRRRRPGPARSACTATAATSFPARSAGTSAQGGSARSSVTLMPPGWTMHRLRHRFATLGYTAVSRDDIRAVCEAATTRNTEVQRRTPDDAA